MYDTVKMSKSTQRTQNLPADPELIQIRTERILPVLTAFQTEGKVDSRLTAASSISHLVKDSKCRHLLLREDLVDILLQGAALCSPLEVRRASWAILKSLIDEEGAGFCVHLYRHHILISIEYTLNRVRNYSNLGSLHLPS